MYTNLINNIKNLLDEYNYEYTTSALEKIINTWAENKATLLEAFKKHPNYLEGEYCIAFDTDYHREIDTRQSSRFSEYLECMMEKYRDDVPAEHSDKFSAWVKTYNVGDQIYHFLTNLQLRAYRTITDNDFQMLTNNLPEIHPHAGEKTSRVVNRICTYLGYSKDPDYNKEFAKYADSLSPMTIKRHTIISLNPLDYLTMSFGNSWASCHTIAKQNRRRMPNSYEGQYSSGTMSYLLDPSSIVFYTVDKSYEGTQYWTQPKINRQMFHYGEDKLVQGRLYPQSNDGNSEEYTAYRQIVQQVIAECFGFPNLWSVSKGVSNACQYIISEGTHYRDYESYDSCTLSRNKSMPNENYFTVGHAPICIECGWEHDISENINCCRSNCRYCADCGHEIDEDEAIYINGDYYCRDCVNYCDCCHEYHRDEEHYIRDSEEYVCDDCFSEYYTDCEQCGFGVDRDETHTVFNDIHGWHDEVCEECLERYYEECSDCEEYHRREYMVLIEDNVWVCPSCFKNYARCSVCGEYHLKADMTETSEDTYICDECKAEEEEFEDAV
jgi:hypothetical protein